MSTRPVGWSLRSIINGALAESDYQQPPTSRPGTIVLLTALSALGRQVAPREPIDCSGRLARGDASGRVVTQCMLSMDALDDRAVRERRRGSLVHRCGSLISRRPHAHFSGSGGAPGSLSARRAQRCKRRP